MPVPAGASTEVNAATTLGDLVAETKRHLNSYAKEPRNRLAADILADADTMVLDFDTAQIQAGAYLQVGLELLYVWSIEPSSKTAVVDRAQLGSKASAHFAGEAVTVNPRFPDFAIVKAINDDLADLSAQGLFAERTVDLVATANSYGYDLANATDLLDILDIRTREQGQPRTWSELTNYRLSRMTDSTDFPSGFALHLQQGVQPGRPIRVIYKASFTPLTSLTNDVTAVSGLPATAMDLPPAGAAIKLVAPREIARNFIDAQGDARRAQEVPPGAVGGSMRALAAWRQGKVADEVRRLQQRWPYRQAIPQQMSVYG